MLRTTTIALKTTAIESKNIRHNHRQQQRYSQQHGTNI